MANENPNPGTSGNEQVQPPKPGEGAGGAASPEWLPEKYRGNPAFGKYKTLEAQLDSHLALESTLGKRVEIPADDASAEVKQAWRTKIGVPEKAEMYEDPSMPEGVEFDKDLVGGFKAFAHEQGMPKAMAKKLADWFVGVEQKRMLDFQSRSAKAKEDGMTALKQQWGAAADINVGLVQRLVSEHGGQSVKEALDRTGAGNDPAILGMLASIARTLAEDNLLDSSGANTGVAEAQAEIAKILAEAGKDRKHAYVDKSNPGHKAMREKVQRLYEIAYPDVERQVL